MTHLTQISLSEVDIAFAELLQAKQSADKDAWLLAAYTSYAYRAGSSCLMLADEYLSHTTFTHPNGLSLGRISSEWSSQQHCCHWWQSDNASTPLVWQENRLYLRRAWQDEQFIQTSIQQRLGNISEIQQPLTTCLTALFQSTLSNHTEPNWQLIACALATRSQFSIITGGPGTGKTTTVVRLLAILHRLAHQSGKSSMHVGLSAPTGKAAARLTSSIQQAMHHLPADFQFNLTAPAQTLHKWLVNDNLSQCDCFIVDEASMIDLHMMAQLLRKLPTTTRLILLGDKDQLASVDAGAVLGQLCAKAEQGNYSESTQQWLMDFAGQSLPKEVISPQANALSQQIIMLRHSHRFDANSAIGQWASWVNQQSVKAVKQAYASLPDWNADSDDAVIRLAITPKDTSALKQFMLTQWQPLKRLLTISVEPSNADEWAKECLGQLSQFQLLCAVRDGQWGLVSMNQRIGNWFAIDSTQWQAGRTVMISRNDYTLNLMNGDMGLCLSHPTLGLRVAFATEQGIRWILPARMAHFENAFAISVHKSQGSEFKMVCLLLPEQDSPILTKELIYTAITRAKRQFILASTNPQQLFQAVGRSVQRSGGLSFE
jgi:exodeoxyribonuclease V alpha subunit